MMPVLIYAILNRLRGHDFTDYYEKIPPQIEAPYWCYIADHFTSKYAVGVYAGLITAAYYGDYWFIPAIAIGWAISFGTGWINFLSITGKTFSIKVRSALKSTLRATLCCAIPLGAYLVKHGLVLEWSALWILAPLTLGIVRLISGYLPTPENAQTHKQLYNRLWKGDFEIHELIYGAVIGLSVWGV